METTNHLAETIDCIVAENGATPSQWKDVTSLISSNSNNSKLFASKIKTILKQKDISPFLIILNLLDYVMDTSSWPLHTQISSKDFITTLLAILKLKNDQIQPIQCKVLQLIRKWGEQFTAQKDILPNFYSTYHTLLNSGVVFPDWNASNSNEYDIYIGINVKPEVSSWKKSETNPSNLAINKQWIQIDNDIPTCKQTTEVDSINTGEKLEMNYGDIWLDLDPDNYEHMFKVLVQDLSTILNYIWLCNEMLDNGNYLQPPDDSLNDIVEQLKISAKDLMKEIQESQITNEVLMEICLGINEDINQVIERYNEFVKMRKPKRFLSCFKTDYKEYNWAFAIEESKKEHEKMVKEKQEIEKKKNWDLITYDFVSGSGDGVANDKIEKGDNKDSEMKDVNDIFNFINQ